MNKVNLLKGLLIIVVGLTAPLTAFQSSLDETYNQAQALLDKGDIDQAETLFLKALEMDPTYTPAMMGLTTVYLHRGDMKSTQKYIRQAIETEPDNMEYREEFDRINEINTLMNDGIRSMKYGDLQQAFETYQLVFEKFPFFPLAPYNMGLVKFRERDYDAAVSYFKKTLELNPDYEAAIKAIANVARDSYNEANNQYRRGDLEGALKTYEHVLEIDPNYYQAHHQIGVIQAKMGNRDKAIEHYQKALDINPNYYKGWFAMGLAKKRNGDYEGALKAFNKAVEINPNYYKAYGGMGDIYLEQRAYDKMISVYKQAVKANPKYSKGYLSLGIALREQGRLKEAAEQVELAVKYNSKYATAWYHLARLYNELYDCTNARRAALEATELRSNFGGGWYELGVAEWCDGKGNKAAALNALEHGRKDRKWRKSCEYEIDRIKNPEKYRE